MMRFLLMSLMMILCGYAQAASALKPLPKAEKLTVENFKKATSETALTFPGKDEFITINLNIPKTWVARGAGQIKNFQTDGRIYGELAWYDAPGEGKEARPYITVRSLALDHDITAKAWLIQYMFDKAYTLRSLNERSFSDVEAIYVTYTDLATYTTWARAVIAGPRILLVEFHVPSVTWERDRDLQIRTMQSLKIENTDKKRIEDLKAFAFLDVATFQYPASWELFRNIIRSPDFFRVALFNAAQNQTPSVQINVQAARIGGIVTLDTMTTEEEKFLETNNLQLKDKLPAPLFVPPVVPKAENVSYQVYTVSTKLSAYDRSAAKTKPVTREYWLTSFDRNGVAYVISMILPSRQSVYQDWARGTRTYQLIIETLAGNLIGEKVKNERGPADTAIPLIGD